MKEFNIGQITKGEEHFFDVKFKTEFKSAYSILEITPYCNCVQVVEYSTHAVYPEDMIEEGEFKEYLTTFEIKFKIKRNVSNEKGTKVEIIFESAYDVFEFKEILIKYEVIDKE